MTEEASDEKLLKYKVSKRLFDDQLEDLCEPPFLMAEYRRSQKHLWNSLTKLNKKILIL